MQTTTAYLANTKLDYADTRPWANYANCTKLLKSISTVRKHRAGFCNCKMNYANGGCLIAKVEINYAKGREYRKTRDHTWQIPD